MAPLDVTANVPVPTLLVSSTVAILLLSVTLCRPLLLSETAPVNALEEPSTIAPAPAFTRVVPPTVRTPAVWLTPVPLIRLRLPVVVTLAPRLIPTPLLVRPVPPERIMSPPPVLLMLALTITAPAEAVVNVRLAPPVVNPPAWATVILPGCEKLNPVVVCTVTLPAAAFRVSQPMMAPAAVGSNGEEPAMLAVPVALMVTSVGSNSHMPALPAAAEVSIWIPYTSKPWPEVSMRPPFPPLAPPRAERLP